MSLAKEFKAFAMRGNVVDLAVGVVIGAAFGKIVSALVDGIIMPFVGFLIAGIDLKDLAYTLHVPGAELLGKPDVVLKYGLLLQNVMDFTIVAFAIFMVIRLMNKLLPPAPTPPPAPKGPTQEELLTEIRDLLKKQGKK